MKIYKRIRGILFAVLAVVLLLPTCAFAAGSIDPGHACSLTLSCQEGGTPLAGVDFSLYLAADVDENGSLTATEAFAGYPVDMQGKDEAAWKTLASTLEGYVLRDGVTPAAAGTTDGKGMLSFPKSGEKLSPGLYLVLGSQHKQNGRIYDIQPSMVLLPELEQETDAWRYDVSVSPKYESHPEPETPGDKTITRKVLKVWKDTGHKKSRPEKVTVQLLRDGEVYDTVTLNAKNNWRHTWEDLEDGHRWTLTEKTVKGYKVKVAREGVTFVVTNTWNTTGDTPSTEPKTPTTPTTPGNSKLPQTGQLWWPVPLLICAGLLLIVAGLARRRGISDEEKKR